MHSQFLNVKDWAADAGSGAIGNELGATTPDPDESTGSVLKASISIIHDLCNNIDEGDQLDAFEECGIKSLAEITTPAEADALIVALEKRAKK